MVCATCHVTVVQGETYDTYIFAITTSALPHPFSIANALNECFRLNADPRNTQLEALNIVFDEVEGMIWNARSASLGNDTIIIGIDVSPFEDILEHTCKPVSSSPEPNYLHPFQFASERGCQRHKEGGRL